MNNSGPWASEVESMKRLTEKSDVSSRRIIKGKRRIRNCPKTQDDDAVAVETVPKSPFTPRNTNRRVSLRPSPMVTTVDSNISGVTSFDVSGTRRKSRVDSPLIRNYAAKNSKIFAKHVEPPIIEHENLTLKRRSRRNTYELQDTVNDLEVLVKESPARNDEKKGAKSPGMNFRGSGNDVQEGNDKKREVTCPGMNLPRNGNDIQEGNDKKREAMCPGMNLRRNGKEIQEGNDKKKEAMFPGMNLRRNSNEIQEGNDKKKEATFPGMNLRRNSNEIQEGMSLDASYTVNGSENESEKSLANKTKKVRKSRRSDLVNESPLDVSSAVNGSENELAKLRANKLKKLRKSKRLNLVVESRNTLAGKKKRSLINTHNPQDTVDDLEAAGKKKRSSINTYNHQDTADDLEILVNESPAKNDDEKEAVKSPGLNLRSNSNEILSDASYTINSSENESEKLRSNKKKKIRKSKRSETQNTSADLLINTSDLQDTVGDLETLVDKSPTKNDDKKEAVKSPGLNLRSNSNEISSDASYTINSSENELRSNKKKKVRKSKRSETQNTSADLLIDTCDLQDTVDDLEVLVKNANKKKAPKSPGMRLRSSSNEISSDEYHSINSSENESGKSRANKKRRVKKSKRSETRNTSASKKTKGLLFNESFPVHLERTSGSNTESTLTDQKEEQGRSKKLKKRSNVREVFSIDGSKNNNRNTYELQEAINGVDELVTSSADEECEEAGEFEVDAIVPGKKIKSKQIDSDVGSDDEDFQRRGTFEITPKVSVGKRSSFKIDPLVEMVSGNKTKSEQIDSDLETDDDDDEESIEVAPKINVGKRRTFKTDPTIEEFIPGKETKSKQIDSDLESGDEMPRNGGSFVIAPKVGIGKRRTFETDSTVKEIEIDPKVKRSVKKIIPAKKATPKQVDADVESDDEEFQRKGTLEINPKVNVGRRSSFKTDPTVKEMISGKKIDSDVESDDDDDEESIEIAPKINVGKRRTFETDPTIKEIIRGKKTTSKQINSDVESDDDDEESIEIAPKINIGKRRTFETDPTIKEIIRGKKTTSKQINSDVQSDDDEESKNRGTFEIAATAKEKRSKCEIDAASSLGNGTKRKSKETDPDESGKGTPNTPFTKRRRWGIYVHEKVATSSSSKARSFTVDASHRGSVFHFPSPWRGQSFKTRSHANLETESHDTFEKPNARAKRSARKMPDYSKIHKRAFERMESVEDHLERKKARANALLSGSKVKIGISAHSTIDSPHSKKQLFLNKNRESTPAKNTNRSHPIRTDKTPVQKENKTPAKIKRCQTPLKSKVPEIAEWLKKQETRSPLKTQFGNTPIKNRSKNISTAAPMKTQFASASVKFQTPINYSIKNRVQTPAASKKSPRKVTPSKSNIPVIKPLVSVKPGMTQFGFKMNARNVQDVKVQARKAVASKTRTQKNAVNERRDYIKGVRSNRRFDLLMNMRQMQKE